jgi:hypothetical protein
VGACSGSLRGLGGLSRFLNYNPFSKREHTEGFRENASDAAALDFTGQNVYIYRYAGYMGVGGTFGGSMKRVSINVFNKCVICLRGSFHILLTPLFLFCGFPAAHFTPFPGSNIPICEAQSPNRYTILFGWKTEGSHELLARQATAFDRFKDTRSLAISFGSLLGPTLIVRHDTANQFLMAARQAGFDYIVPGARELMFGPETALRFAENDRYPRFISANIVDSKTKKPLFDPYATWYVSGLRICIIAISDTASLAGGKIEGVDAISVNEALTAVSVAVAREHADIVVVAGRVNRDDIVQAALNHPFVDEFLTNFQSGGFSEAGIATSTTMVAGKPVYIGSEAGNQLGMLSVRDLDGSEEREFTTLTLGDAFPPEKTMFRELSDTLEEFKKRDTEETAIVTTGGAVASTLRKIFGTDAVFLQRQSLYYYPLKDSLTIFNVRNVIKPFEKVARYEMKGSILKSVLEDMKSRQEPADRLILAGIAAEGKIDTVSIVDDQSYTVLTTTHLRSGGNGFIQFREGTNESLNDINMLASVESFLVDKDKLLRKLARTKPWNLALSMKIGANLNKVDVNDEKSLYSSIPAPFGSMTDQFLGYFSFASNGNTFTYQKRRHTFTSTLDMSYMRTGSRVSSSKVIYGIGNDQLRLYNKYVYNVPTFASVPYVDLTFTSAIHPGGGRHPLRADVSTGLTRKLPQYWMQVSVGLNGSRDYVSYQNTLGSKTEISVSKVFPPRSLFSAPTQFSSQTRIFWWPSAEFHSLFRHENENSLSIGVWRKIDITFQIKTYSYQDNTQRKIAAGFQYWGLLNYGMTWKY